MTRIAIEGTRLLLVEGRDEKEFFSALHRHMGVRSIQVLDYEGKTKLRASLPAIARLPGFDRVSHLGITRDADDDPNSAFQSVQDALRDSQLPFPETQRQFTLDTKPLVGVFILPGEEQPGMLEDLCLSTVANHPVLGCVAEYMDCLSERVRDGTQLPQSESKARAHAFLAGMPKLVTSVGLGAQRSYWNLDADVLQHIRAFLKVLAG